MTVEKSLNLSSLFAILKKMGIVIVSTSKGYFEYPGLNSSCGLYPFFFFWTLMHHTPLTSCHSVFKSYNVILLFCSILTRLASFVPSWEGESALTSLNHCAPGGFSSYSYCHAFISWHSDFMSVLCSWLMGIVFGRWIYWSSAVPLSLWALKAQG